MTFNGPCFPLLDISVVGWIGGSDWNQGFISRVLITNFWNDVPEWKAVWYAISSVQLALATVGIVREGWAAFFRKVGGPNPGREEFHTLTEHVIPFLLFLWLFWLALLNILLPTQWMSTTTFAIILLHVWAELPSFVIRVVLISILGHDPKFVDAKRLTIAMWWASRSLFIFAVINFVLWMTAANPYIEGLLDSFAFVADFGNLTVAPFIAYRMYRIRTSLNSADQGAHRVEEGLLAAMQVIHVILYYVQAFLACSYENVAIAAGFMVVVEAINVVVFIGYTVHLFTRTYSEKDPESANLLDGPLFPAQV
jgi:hypothetical protein